MNSIEQGGKFTTPAARNKAVKEGLRALFDERVGANQGCAPELEGDLKSLLNSVVGSLRHEPPEASQAAEAALSIAQFSLSEGRVLNVIDLDAGDLNENGRLDGDRSVGDFLCREILQPRQIPATKGPLQSSSFRGGYLSRQVRNSALKKYVEWQSRDATTLDEVRAFAVGIVDVMLAQASKMPAWVDITASKLTFASYLQVRERLLAEGSGGAFEQYLLAGLMNAEFTQSPTALRVDTKSVGANDRATSWPGDIVIRERQAARTAFEVTAAGWETKVGQLEAAAKQGLTEATIVGPKVPGDYKADQLAAILKPAGDRLGIDPAVVDLHAYMDVLASRISPHGRAEALTYVYQCLVRWHTRQPELAQRLIDILDVLGLVAGARSQVGIGLDLTYANISIDRFRDTLSMEKLTDHPDAPELLRLLADQLEYERES